MNASNNDYITLLHIQEISNNQDCVIKSAGTYAQLLYSKGTLPTYPLDSIFTNCLASWELAKELVRKAFCYVILCYVTFA